MLTLTFLNVCMCFAYIYIEDIIQCFFAFRNGCGYGRTGIEPVFKPRPVHAGGQRPGMGVLGLVLCPSHHWHWRGKWRRCLPASRDRRHSQQPTTAHAKGPHCVHWLLLHQSFCYIQGEPSLQSDHFRFNFYKVFSIYDIHVEIFAHMLLIVFFFFMRIYGFCGLR